MAVIGWLFCFLMLGGTSLAWGLSAVFGLSKYNIGGVPNSITTKATIILVGFVIGFSWYALLASAPFEVILK